MFSLGITGGPELSQAQEAGHSSGHSSGSDSHAGGAGGAGRGQGAGGGGQGGAGRGQGGGQSGTHGSSHGGEITSHGTGAGHAGHTSGVHAEDTGVRRDGSSKTKGYAASRRFAGGAGIWGGEQVPEGIANLGSGDGSGPVSRLRYWGGWDLYPEDNLIPPGGGGMAAGISVLDGQPRCEDISPGVLEPLSTRNWSRLGTAFDLVQAPDQAMPDQVRQRGMFTLAVYQFELLSEKPDIPAAATHLAAVSRVPVDPETIAKINWALCIGGGTPETASTLANLAQARQHARAGGPR
jgi:hypothetical protein